MNDLDDRLRELVRTIGEASPEPPSLREAPQRPAPSFVVSGPVVAIVSFAAVVAVFVGLRVLLGGGGAEDPTATGVSVTVRHQVVEFGLEAQLQCGDPTGAGTSTMSLETWADFSGAQYRQRATYGDGSNRDRILVGDLNYPTRTYGRGNPQLLSPACGADLLGGDPTDGTNFVFLNAPFDPLGTPGYEDLGVIVAGTHTDSLGRPSVLYREVIDGTGTFTNGTEYAIHQVREWYVDPDSGDVLERVSTQQGDGQYDVRQTITVVSDESIDVDAGVFDPAGFEVEWDASDALGPSVDATPIVPSITLGRDVIWPEPLEPDGPEAVAGRFAAEVLGWDNPTITLDPEAADNAPTWITIDDGQGHQLAMLAAPNGSDGWGLVQIGTPQSLSVGPAGVATIQPAGVEGATRLTIHAATLDGSTLAWQVDLTSEPRTVVLDGIQIGDIATLLVIYQDPAGNTLLANGGQHGTP